MISTSARLDLVDILEAIRESSEPQRGPWSPAWSSISYARATTRQRIGHELYANLDVAHPTARRRGV